MRSLVKAIITKWESNQDTGSAYARVGGRVYYGQAPATVRGQTISFPFIVWAVVSTEHGIVFGPKNFDQTRIQVSIFSDTRNSIDEASLIAEQVKVLFDGASLDFTETSDDYTSVRVWRSAEDATRDEDVWHYRIDYLIRTQEA